METTLNSIPSQIITTSINDLSVPAWNPRKSMDEKPLQLLTDYIRGGRPLPRIQAWKGQGMPPYQVISGQRRLAAYRRAGFEKVEVEILDITLEEARILASTSNEGEPLEWLDKFENWETLLADYPKWGGISELASILGKDTSQVSRGLSLMKLLTPDTRQVIRNSMAGQGSNFGLAKISTGEDALQDRWTFNERAATRLTPLLKGRTLPEAQALAEKAIPLIFSKQMTSGQVEQWVKQANGGGSKAPKTAAPTQAQVSQGPATTVAASAPSSSPAKEMGSHLAGLLKGTKGWATAGLAGAIGGFLASNLKRALGTLTRRWLLHGVVATGAIFLGAQWLGSHKQTGRHSQAVALAPANPQAQNASGIPVVLKGNPAEKPADSLQEESDSAAPMVPEEYKARVEAGSRLAEGFAKKFYEPDSDNTAGWINDLNSDLSADYSDAFFKDFCPPVRIEDIRQRQLFGEFHITKPPKVLAVGTDGEEVLIEGMATLSTSQNGTRAVLAQGPVALELNVVHTSDGDGGKIDLVKERTGLTKSSGHPNVKQAKKTNPSSTASQNQATGTDPAAKFLGDAAGEAAKKALGF